MDDLPIKKGQSSVRFSILNEQSAMKTGGSNKLGAIGSSRKDLNFQKRPPLERKQHIDPKTLEIMVNELYNTLIALNTNFKDLFKRQKLKTPSKQTFNEILSQLLLLYDDNNASSINLSDEEIIQLFKDLGYPYQVREDVLKIIGAPHNWTHAVSMLHWLSQVIEADGAGEELDLMAERTSDGLPEENIFDIVRKGVDKRVTPDELAKNYLSQEDAFADEEKARVRLARIEDEVNRVRHEIEESKRNQPSLNELKNSLDSILTDIEKVRNTQASLRSEINQALTHLNQDKFRLEQKQETITELTSMLHAAESQSKTQMFDSDTEKRYLKEIKDDTNFLETLREAIQKKTNKEIEIQKNIQNEQSLIKKLKEEFYNRLHEIQKEINLDIQIELPKEEYRTVNLPYKIIDKLQHDLDKALSSQIEAMQRLETAEHVLRNQVESLDRQNREIELRCEDLGAVNRQLNDKLNASLKNKNNKEVTINSKKTTLMADIHGQTTHLNHTEKEIDYLTKEILKQEKEIMRMKQLINDHVVNSQDLLVKFKANHIDQIKDETQRITFIKESLLDYLKNKKKP